MKEVRKQFVFKNRKTGVIENWYGTPAAAGAHLDWNPDLYCIKVTDIKRK